MSFYSERIFPRMCDFYMREMGKFRAGLLEDVAGRALEVGHGTGGNLPYLKKLDSLVAVEPSAGMNRRAEKRRESLLGEARFPIDLVAASAEELPFENESFDTVVATWTFCSIPDHERAAREAFRVLRPGGRFYFIEHVRSPDPDVAKWQDRLNGFWRRFACGCNLNRDLFRSFESAGFDMSETSRINIAGLPILRHHIVGRARKNVREV